MLKQYLAYIRNNPQKYWFKAKLYGWGWVPAKWQGWLTLLIFIALFSLNSYRIDSTSHSVSDTLLNLIPVNSLLVVILLFICYKTGEKPKWRWGINDKKEE